MVNEYKKIVLLVGLEAIKDYEFRLIKSLLAKDLKLTRNMQEDYDRIRIADLMEEKFQRDAGLGKLITLCKDIPALADLAETLKTRRLKVKRKSKGEKKSTGKKVEQDESPTAQSRSTTNTDSEPESEEEIPSLKHQKRKPTSVKKKERLKLSQENKMKKSEDPERTQLPPEQGRFMEPSATSEEQTAVCPQTPHGAPPEPSNSPPVKRPKIKKSVPLVNKQEKISSSFQEGQEMEATNSKTNNVKAQESQGQRQLPQLSEIGVKPPQCIIHTHQMPPTAPTSSVHTPQKPPTAPPSSVHTLQKPPTAPSSSVHIPLKPPTAPSSSVHTAQMSPTAPPSSVHTLQKPPTAPTSIVHTPQKPPTSPPSSVHTLQKPPTAPTSIVHTPQKPPTAPSSSVHIPQKPPTAPSSSVHTAQMSPTAPPSSVHTPQKPPTAPPSSVHTPQMPPTAPSGKTNTFHLLLTLPSGVQTSHMSPPDPSGRIQTPHFSPTSSRGIQGPHTSPTSCSKIQTPQVPPAAPAGRTPTPQLPRTSPSEFQTTHVSLTSSSRVQTPHMCPEDPSGKIQTPHFSPTSSRGIQGPHSSPASSSRIQTPQMHPTEPSTIIQNPQVGPATPSASLQTPQKTVTSFSSCLPTNPRLKTVPKEASEECGHQKGPKEVVVLKVTEPFTYEFKEGGKKMFHATVATESEFFRVKVFDINLKDKFIPKTVIAISDYIGRNGFLELYSASTVSHVSADRKMEISKTLIKNANATPKIEYLCSRSTTKYVNGVYMVYKKNVREDCTYYEIQDDTGKMEVVVYGRLTYINCEEGDKLNLFCFELTLNADKWQLRSVFHSYIKVIKGNRSKICPFNRDSNVDTSQESSLKPGYH
ncbi:Hypothetical predicted protein [Marmota monax]|uniref:Pyrin domain-containing protein n=1 Tax=Marmota monax TaxID=9995 RepID=A0A5E4CLX9_MARMO|nr:Hypothetical predicted protein [Marmota monax]